MSEHGELRRLIIEYADEGLDHRQIYEKLEGNYPDLVDEFVASERAPLVIQAIRMVVGAARRHRIRRARFAEAAAKIAAGEALYAANFPSADGQRKTLAEMTKQDLLHAAVVRERAAVALVDEARLLRQIARKVRRDQVVSDVYSPQQITELVQRFTSTEESA